MYRFQASIHALPNDSTTGSTIELDGIRVATLVVSPKGLGSLTFARTFEEVMAGLQLLERLFIEADGSFVWVSSQQDLPWQIDGNLYDHQDRLRFVDIKGTCPPNEFDRFLDVLGWPNTRLMFQLVRAAVFLDEAEFRRHASQMAFQK